MASTACRNRRSPVARFTNDELDNEIKAQIGDASLTQRALRHRQFSHPKPTGGLPLQRNSQSFDGAARHDSLNLSIDTEPPRLDRANSFNSLSTLQRESEAARQSQWRDSPVSAYMPSDRTVPFVIDQKIELGNPCPPLTIYTLKQARKDRKEERRSLKKKEKEQKKADRLAAHRRRASEVQITAVSLHNDDSKASDVPKRAASDPSSFKASKEAAIQLVKKLTTTKSRLSRKRSRNDDATAPPPPHIDDFLTKPALQEYLNPTLPETTTGIAELPGPLPPYTPFQDSTRNEKNAPVSDLEPILVSRSYSNPQSGFGCESPASSRMMRCDHCQFGIKLDEQYFHCSICNNGDRIVCSACDASGLSCRHELTERVRRVLRYDDGGRQRSVSRHGPRRRQTAPPVSEDTSRSTLVPLALPQAELQQAPAAHTAAYNALREKQFNLELKDLTLRRREQEITFREREASLKEREANLRISEAEADARNRQQEATLRIREAEAEARNRQQEANAHMLMASLGAQFARSVSQKSTATSSDEDALADSDQLGVRNHAGKRKSGATGAAPCSTKPSTQAGKNGARKVSVHQELEEDDDDEDDTGAGTPKKPRLNTELVGEALWACHFCKFNSQRYSERNNAEKHYRGCSSGYWPDISRLKQHLYRVHWKRRHCRRCYQTFKSQEELDRHSREVPACTMRDCPFPEKFDDDKLYEIKRKRPASSPEEVWYIIYEILFPGYARPTSPFSDSNNADATSASASAPPGSAQRCLDVFRQIFEARLDQQQDVAFLQTPGAREFFREQVQATMADVIRSMVPLTVNGFSAGPPSTERSPVSATSSRAPRPSLRVESSCGPSLSTSPDPISATSTHSNSSSQWLLPSHRRSFSRILPSKTESTHEPTLSSAAETTPSDVIFSISTPIDPENDQYDDESHSWQKGDELGLAITTSEEFDFNFGDQPLIKSHEAASMPQGFKPDNGYPPGLPPAPAFKAVKVASLADHPTTRAADQTWLKPTPSSATLDSGYNSMSSRPSTSSPQTHSRLRMKSSTAPPIINTTTHDQLDPGVDMAALEVPFGDFLGAEMDEFGNVDGRSLTHHLYRMG